MLQNIHRIEGDVAYISLTQGQEAIIDTADLANALQCRWHAMYNKQIHGYYVHGTDCGKAVFLHRYLLNPPVDMQIDHINHNTLDNRRCNLRIVTASENCLNRNQPMGATGIRHVAYVDTPRWKGYHVTIMRNGVGKIRGFPVGEDGWKAACELAERWEIDPSYDPPKQQRFGRLAPHTVPDRQERRAIPHVVPSLSDGEWLTDGEVAYLGLNDGQVTIVDAADVNLICCIPWNARQMQGPSSSWYVLQNFNCYLHRYLMDAQSGTYVDHINHDTLDNRKSNLRIVTNQVNNANRAGAYNTSRTGIRGVSVHKGNGKNPQLYIFRCHIVTCKASKYFPFSGEGLEAAKVFSEAHYAALKDT